jgi:hypothetical protein
VRQSARSLAGCVALCVLWQLAGTSKASAAETPEYRLKAAFLYNFAQLTDWPADIGAALRICIPWQDPFGQELDALQGQPVGERRIVLLRGAGVSTLKDCQLLFIPTSAVGDLPQILIELRDSPVLTVAESPGAAQSGVAINMRLEQNRITFEVNPKAARSAGLQLSPTLLRLAREVVD